MNLRLTLCALAALVAVAWSAQAGACSVPAPHSERMTTAGPKPPCPKFVDSINPQPLPPHDSHLAISSGGRNTAARDMQLASGDPTDWQYCWMECTPDSGCQRVCRHLVF